SSPLFFFAQRAEPEPLKSSADATCAKNSPPIEARERQPHRTERQVCLRTEFDLPRRLGCARHVCRHWLRFACHLCRAGTMGPASGWWRAALGARGKAVLGLVQQTDAARDWS